MEEGNHTGVRSRKRSTGWRRNDLRGSEKRARIRQRSTESRRTGLGPEAIVSSTGRAVFNEAQAGAAHPMTDQGEPISGRDLRIGYMNVGDMGDNTLQRFPSRLWRWCEQ